MILDLKNIEKYYGENHVVKNLNLTIQEGEFLTILGPSGCGKTTTLRMIAGFELPKSGSITLKGDDITQLPPYKRHVNTVFQNYALFPNMTVAENIAFGLQQKNKSKDEIKKKVGEMLEMVRLTGFGDRKPQELSGGQQQRVAIARAVANDPLILLLDEPLGALDLKLRKNMQSELKSLHRELNKTFIYVTHDQEEALTMSDRVAVMNQGVLEQVSDSHELYYHPKSRFVADFIGEANVINGTVSSRDALQIDEQKIPLPNHSLAIGSQASLFVRPENINVSRTNGKITGTIVEIVFVGIIRKYVVQCGSQRITMTETTRDDSPFNRNEKVFLDWDIAKTSIF